jgi:hypothetical protein
MKRFNQGLYETTIGDKIFQIEKFPDGSWHLFEVLKTGAREWINDFGKELVQ